MNYQMEMLAKLVEGTKACPACSHLDWDCTVDDVGRFDDIPHLVCLHPEVKDFDGDCTGCPYCKIDNE